MIILGEFGFGSPISIVIALISEATMLLNLHTPSYFMPTLTQFTTMSAEFGEFVITNFAGENLFQISVADFTISV